jgi:hypothetical protein
MELEAQSIYKFKNMIMKVSFSFLILFMNLFQDSPYGCQNNQLLRDLHPCFKVI